jgi:DNA-binding response OmpR family regulator
MLKGMPILIVENEPLIALDLSEAVKDRNGIVIGPVPTVAEALAILAGQSVGAAILDARLDDRDITPVAIRLIEQAVPFIIHTGTGLPAELAASHPDLPVILKPKRPEDVVASLEEQLQGQPDLVPQPCTAEGDGAPK